MQKRRLSLTAFIEKYSSEKACQQYLAQKRWPEGFVCPKCGAKHSCSISRGLFQCAECHRQTSVTAGTIMHGSHVSLVKWFQAYYFVSQDKRGISAVQLAAQIAVTYKTAWYMLKRIRVAMGQREQNYLLSGTIEFDDTFIGGPTVGKKRGRGTEKAKVFAALSLTDKGYPQYLKMAVTTDIRQNSVKAFAEQNIRSKSTVISDGYRSYVPALEAYDHQHKTYDPKDGMLHWLHMLIGNAKAEILGTYHGLPKTNLQDYLNEFCFRFNRRSFGGDLFDRLVVALAVSHLAEAKG